MKLSIKKEKKCKDRVTKRALPNSDSDILQVNSMKQGETDHKWLQSSGHSEWCH